MHVQTWHHGLIADWWANFNLDAPEIELAWRSLDPTVSLARSA